MPRKKKCAEPIGDALEQLKAAGKIKTLTDPEPALPEPQAEIPQPASPPLGPKKREPGTPGSVFTHVGHFRLTEDGRERALTFDAPPSDEEKAQVKAAGLRYAAARKSWVARATPDVREATDKLALELAGKDVGRGR